MSSASSCRIARVRVATSCSSLALSSPGSLRLPEPGRPGLVDAFLDERREELEPRRPRPGADDLEQMVLDLDVVLHGRQRRQRLKVIGVVLALARIRAHALLVVVFERAAER